MSSTVFGGLPLVKVRMLKVRGTIGPGQVVEFDALRAGILIKNGDAALELDEPKAEPAPKAKPKK